MNDYPKNKFLFHGSGSTYFGIQIVNIFLTIITLGLYYPWAKAASLKYIYQETEFMGSRFAFHGTGKEMFKGLVKALGIVILLYSISYVSQFSGSNVLIIVGSIIFVAGFLFLIPLVIHGSVRYRLSRTTWRGIHFGYRGNLKELYSIYFTGIFYSIFTLGFYIPWLTVNIRKYVLSNARIGNVSFDFEGKGGDLLGLHIKGYLLSVFTLGIYFFAYFKNIFKFYTNNTSLIQDDQISKLELDMSAFDLFKNIFVNFLIVMFTLGLGAPFAVIRSLDFMISKIQLVGNFDPDKLEQTEENYSDATSEDLSDMLDIDII